MYSPGFTESIRQATIRAAIDAYEDAGVQGLCEEGRWEAALSAMRALDLSRVAGNSPAPRVGEKVDR